MQQETQKPSRNSEMTMTKHVFMLVCYFYFQPSNPIQITDHHNVNPPIGFVFRVSLYSEYKNSFGLREEG